MKKKGDGVVNYASTSAVLSMKSTSKSKLHSQQQVSPALLVQQAYLF